MYLLVESPKVTQKNVKKIQKNLGKMSQWKDYTIVARWSLEEGVGRVTKYWHWPGWGLRGSPPGILNLMTMQWLSILFLGRKKPCFILVRPNHTRLQSETFLFAREIFHQIPMLKLSIWMLLLLLNIEIKKLLLV